MQPTFPEVGVAIRHNLLHLHYCSNLRYYSGTISYVRQQLLFSKLFPKNNRKPSPGVLLAALLLLLLLLCLPAATNFYIVVSAVVHVLEMHACVGRDQHLWYDRSQGVNFLEKM